MSWSDDPKTPQRFEHNSAAAKKLPSHPAKALMDQRWEARRARSAPPASEPAASGIRVKPPTSQEQPRLPPPIPLAALMSSRPAALSEPAHAAVSSTQDAPLTAATATSPEPARDAVTFLGNPQRALLLIALGASSIVFALLYFGDFLK